MSNLMVVAMRIQKRSGRALTASTSSIVGVGATGCEMDWCVHVAALIGTNGCLLPIVCAPIQGTPVGDAEGNRSPRRQVVGGSGGKPRQSVSALHSHVHWTKLHGHKQLLSCMLNAYCTVPL